MALVVTMSLSMCLPSVIVHAEETPDGLCVHHPEHTDECGYVEAVAGQACSHVHDETCGYVEAVEGQDCTHICTEESGCIVTNCIHIHDEACGYIEGDEGSCTHLCTEESGCVTVNCIHTHDELCGYAETVEGSPCTHVHDGSCGYVEAEEGLPCKYAVEGCPYCVVSWAWVDDRDALVWDGDRWTLAAPGASEAAPLTRDALAELLPAQILAATDNGQNVALDLIWDLTSIPESGAADGDYTLTAALTATEENYALTENAAALEVTVQLGGAEAYTAGLTLPSGDPPFYEHIVNGVSPNGTVINLFDYWLTERTDSDNSDPDWRINKGINNGHALLFRQGDKNTQGIWNKWTGNKKPRAGIVQDKLVDGYPKLNLDTSTASDENMHRDGTESLAYLFHPDYEHEGKEIFEDVQGLLQVDDQGYYYYNSQENYAVYYADTNSFTLYEYPGVVPGGTSPVGQFFPFNEATADAASYSYNNETYTLMSTSKSTDASINHYFGLHMSTRFVQENGGHTDHNKTTPVTYEFSGDDDVWIFIDGVLVADLGGIHDAASVKIDFSTGQITINDIPQSQTLGDILGTNSYTLTDNTYHTLDFFYLERGNTDSNMYLRYNLVTIPESDLIKIDQLGNPVAGTTFTLYGAQDYETNKQSAVPIAAGTTDGSGKFIFLETDAAGNSYPITIDKLYAIYGQTEDSDGNNLILVETQTPEGYRSVGEIGLYFYKNPNSYTDEVLLLSNSIWDKGAYAMPKVTTTTGNSISLLNNAGDVTGGAGETAIYLVGADAVENPLMFGVVFQKQDNGTWLPVSGDPISGWTVWEDSSWDSILRAAIESPYIFQLASSGAYQVEIGNLPGDVRTYYHLCQDEDKAEYTIAYYYTTAGTLADATAENTRRIDSESTTHPLDRVFSMDLYVTNIKNRLLVQKVDNESNTVNGAEFSLYKASDVTVADDGAVTVNDNANAYDSLTTANVTGILNLNGGGIFPTGNNVLELGEYYLIETSAPNGYKLNDTAVHVIVDNTGVYADAGTANDGVTVLRGVGSVMRSMVQFAVDDGVDTTLQGIKAALATSVTYNGYNKDGSFTVSGSEIDWNSTGKDVLHLQYTNTNSMLDYGLHDTSISGTIDNLTLATEEGWSKLLIQQCYQHDNSVLTSLKSNLAELGYTDITNLFSGTVTVRVTNEQAGNLTVSKTVTGTEGEQDREWTFTVTLSGTDAADVDGAYGEMTFTDGVATFTLTGGQSKTATGLPADISYMVTETGANGDGYTTAATGDTGTIQMGQTATAAFTNNRDTLPPVEPDTGSLTVTKTVTGAGGDTAKAWNFTVTLSDTTVNGTYGGMSFNGGEATFTLKHNESKTAAGLPAGTAYTVTEAEADEDGYTTTSTGAVGIITKDATSCASFTNHKSGGEDSDPDPTGSLKITKTVTGGGDPSKEFIFCITITTSSGTELETHFPYAGSKSGTIKSGDTITLKDGEYIIISSIPSGSKYIVTEEQADGYTITSVGNIGAISNGKTSVAAFVNEWGGISDPDPTDPTDPTTPTDPTDPTDPTAPTDPTDPTDLTNPTDLTDSPNDPNTPKTGDPSMASLWSLLSAGSLAGLFLSAKKKLFYQGKRIRR